MAVVTSTSDELCMVAVMAVMAVVAVGAVTVVAITGQGGGCYSGGRCGSSGGRNGESGCCVMAVVG